MPIASTQLALQAAMDGYDVEPLARAVARSDFVVTVTGDKHVLDREHFAAMKDGCVIANAGHFNVEINIPALEAMAAEKQRPRAFVEEYLLPDGRRIRLLAEGRLVNLAAAEGHPAAVMDMSFANQALSVAWLADNARKLDVTVHSVSHHVDAEIARLKLSALGMEIDALTEEQHRYLHTWEEAT